CDPPPSSNLRKRLHALEPTGKRALARHGKIVSRLQIKPIFSRLAERLAEQQRQLGGDWTRPADDVPYPHWRYADGACKCGLRHAELRQNLGEKFSRMDCEKALFHGACPLFTSVIVGDLNIKCVADREPEAEAPLVVDPDAVLAGAIARQCFELI